ncbi:uncharacterized protein V1478_001620 [Vespula squamosa]|uniref:Uncharacterized protein n=1 Tax=Vespula squamosa TaxID=30214 RepID=A0ABD2C238_VESSQ
MTSLQKSYNFGWMNLCELVHHGSMKVPFILICINQDYTKYKHVISKSDRKHICNVLDVITSPPATQK